MAKAILRGLMKAKLKNKFFLGGVIISALSLFGIFLLTCAPTALAQTFTLDLGDADNNRSLTGHIVQLLAVTTVISLAPSIFVMMTSFTRIIVVLSFLRTAIGIQQTPPNMVIISLALFLTFFVMAPTFQTAYTNGIAPLISEDIDEATAFERTTQPFRQFMMDHVREDDLKLFVDLGKVKIDDPAKTPLQTLVPAFMISELRRAFEMGFMLFLPFLIIDMVTASILMSMGMMMLPPVMISLPFKIIFFVLVDGWHLIAGTLIKSFEMGPMPGAG